MKLNKILLASAFMVLGVALFPMITKNSVDKQLQEHIASVEVQGLNAKKLSDKGYFYSQIKVLYTISDGQKFKNFVLDKLVSIQPSAKAILDKAKDELDNIANEALDGTQVEALFTISNLVPADTQVDFALTKLSTQAMQEIEKNKKMNAFFSPILENKALSINVLLDTYQQVKKLTLKDIKLDTDGFEMQLKGTELELAHGDGIEGVMSIDKQVYSMKDRYSTLNVNLGKILYEFDYINDFNSAGKISLNDISITEKRSSSSSDMKMGLIELESKVGSSDALNLDIATSYAVRKFSLEEKRTSAFLDYATWSINFEKLNKVKVQKLVNAYKSMLLAQSSGAQKRVATKEFIAVASELINNGFVIKAELSLKGLDAKKIVLEDVKANFNVELKKNSIDFTRSRMNAFFDALALKGQVSITDQDANYISENDPGLAKVISLGRKEATKLHYDIELQGKDFYVNNNKL